MIKIRFEEGRHVPIVKCDICNQQIQDADLAMVLIPPGYAEGTEIDVKHVHKGQCDQQAQRDAGGFLPWQPLDHHLIYLTNNVNLSPEKMIAIRKALEEIGM